MQALIPFVQVFLFCVFAVSGLAKWLSFASFRNTVAQLSRFPVKTAGAAAHLVIAAEIASGVMLLIDTLAICGAFTILALTLLFAALSLRSAVRGTDEKCHCFGQLTDERLGVETLVKSAILAGLALIVLLNGEERISPAADPVLFAFWITDSLLVICLYILVDRMRAYLRKLRRGSLL
jgi:uncharacterized membrane protein YphA (DoxX/SURF4 family)